MRIRVNAHAVVLLLGWGALAGPPDALKRTGFETGIQAAEVEFRNGTTVLRGTIIQPAASGPGPGVVILGGSERGARNAYKRRIASDFAASGISALVYDSPGTGASTGNAVLQTKDDRVVEALAAVRFLRGRPGIEPHTVGLWGISEGSGIALLAAGKDPEVAFVVSVSPALGVAPVEISRFRIEMTGYENRFSQEDIGRALVLEEILYELFSGAGLAEWRLIGMKVRNWQEEPWAELIEAVKGARRAALPEERKKTKDALIKCLDFWKEKGWFRLAVPDVGRFERLAALEAEAFLAFLDNNPWARGDWLDHLRASAELSGVRSPVLAIWGENDLFLPPHRSAAVLRRLLQGTKIDLTIEILPGIGHTMAYSGQTDISPKYTEIVKDWLKAKVRIQ